MNRKKNSKGRNVELLVVDDENIRALIRKYAGYRYGVTKPPTACKPSNCRSRSKHIIMDIMMPGAVVSPPPPDTPHNRHSDTHAFRPRRRYDKINAFNLGIDDYIVKPFSPKS